jgi:predicted dehydrogenase
MGSGVIRIGIVGAGGITRTRHLPGFLALTGVRVTAVCNRRRESASKIAREFDIPRIHDTWESLVDDDMVDAVVVAAWPNLHCPVTLAAFDAGKHVLTQARMAMNAREAQRMYDRAHESPNLAAMVVPSPYGLTGDAAMRALIADGYLGTLRELHARGVHGDLADPETPLSWRQMTKYSGFNMLQLGILYETVIRWSAPATRVLANATRFIAQRKDAKTGKLVRTGTPDSVDVLTSHGDGSRGVYRLSGVALHDHSLGVTLYGSEGTLDYDFALDQIRGARRGERELAPVEIPDELRGGWQVEADFVAAIRGERPVTHTTFATGVRYMQFTEAVARSSRHQGPVDLPLKEFSNPSL